MLIKRNNKIQILRLVLIACAIFWLGGCASSTTETKSAEKPVNEAPSASATAITNIDSSVEDSQTVIFIKGSNSLNYSATKQDSPLAVILYFPDTKLDGVEADTEISSPIATHIKASELTERKLMSRVEIPLQIDTDYEVLRVDDATVHVKIFHPTAKAEEKADGSEETPSNIATASTINDVTVSTENDSVLIHVSADGRLDNIKKFSIQSPERVVFDLYDVSSDFKNEKKINVDSNHIQSVRYYGYEDRVRLVIDLPETASGSIQEFPVPAGLDIKITPSTAGGAPAVASSTVQNDLKKAWVNRVDFSNEPGGNSNVYIGTTAKVEYTVLPINQNKIEVRLQDTNIPEYQQRPLVTTRFDSAIDRISPVQTKQMADESLIVIELRESVPYLVQQDENIITLKFDKSSVPPQKLNEKNIPDWQAAMAETLDVSAVAPMAASISTEARSRGKVDDAFQQIADTQYGTEEKKVYRGEKIALDFYETDIKNVFRIIQSISKKNFAIDKDVRGKVTLTLDQPVPWDQVLDLVLKMNSLGMVYENDIIRIATLSRLQKEEKLRNDVIQAKKKNIKAKKDLEPLLTEYIPVNYSDAKTEILPHIVSVVTPKRGTVSVDQRNNQLIITDTAEKIERISSIVHNIDKVTPQVVIEARVVEATTNFTREIGTSWSLEDGQGSTGDDTVFTYAMGAANLPSQSNGAIGVNFTRIAGNNIVLDAKLQAFESTGEVKIISSPKIITLDNKEAKIEQGVEYPYLKEIDDDGTAQYELKELSLILTVTPHVTPDNRVGLKINIEKNDLGEEVSERRSFLRKNAVTELLVDDGDTVVIGGIIKTRSEDNERRVPFFYKIPVLGWLFKATYTQSQKEELLLFITPRIVQLEQKLS